MNNNKSVVILALISLMTFASFGYAQSTTNSTDDSKLNKFLTELVKTISKRLPITDSEGVTVEKVQAVDNKLIFSTIYSSIATKELLSGQEDDFARNLTIQACKNEFNQLLLNKGTNIIQIYKANNNEEIGRVSITEKDCSN